MSSFTPVLLISSAKITQVATANPADPTSSNQITLVPWKYGSGTNPIDSSIARDQTGKVIKTSAWLQGFANAQGILSYQTNDDGNVADFDNRLDLCVSVVSQTVSADGKSFTITFKYQRTDEFPDSAAMPPFATQNLYDVRFNVLSIKQ